MNRTARTILLAVLIALAWPVTAAHAASVWQRHGAPVLTASQSWEGKVVQEPNVWFAQGEYRMIYTGGWMDRALGYATARRPGGPWHKHGRILGQGFGGWGGVAAHSSIYREDGKLWVLFSDGVNLHAAVGNGPGSLVTLPDLAMVPQAGGLNVVNTSLVKRGDKYVLVYESHVETTAWWNMGLATADSPAGPFTTTMFPLPALEQHPDGGYGGPNLRQTKTGAWVLWYHAARGPGGIPTRLYRAESDDLVTWSAPAEPQIGMRSFFEVDQVADPYRVRQDGRTYVFWDGMDNPSETGVITYGERRR